MTLADGARVGPYEILSALGAGGMGEVYKARDTRLDRIVAIKILPEALAADPQFRDRFEREARAISKLTHPHICTLYDIGRQDLTDFLVMEYLEGDTLAARLAKGALPLDQALTIAIQIASALDAAHRAGIVHRDLKPGNVMLTRSGGKSAAPIAKLLDFGLAKATAPVVAGAGLSMLPTTPPNRTGEGAILGTFQYMAPEQLEGQEADARTDIFAFGAVLYEMVTGKKAFEAKTHASLIAAILDRDPPPISITQPLTPPGLDRVAKKCLAKDPETRWQTARDLTDELTWVAEAGAEPVSTGRSSRARLAWMVAAAASLLAAIVLAWPAALYFRRATPEPVVTRLDVVTPPTTEAFSFALSLDGRRLVFVANGDKGSQLWLRPLDQATAQPLAGTEGALYPFWSPDGRALGFFADAKLKRMDLSGGPPQVLADAPATRGGTWNRAGMSKVLIRGGSHAHYVPTRLGSPTRAAREGGHLVYGVAGTLRAVAFDLGRLEVVGTPALVLEGVVTTGVGAADVAVAANGSLVYVPGVAGGGGRQTVLSVDRQGRASPLPGLPPDAYRDVRVSPDGARLALATLTDVWTYDVVRATLSRLTTDPALDRLPLWTPDGQRIVFTSTRAGYPELFWRPADGTGRDERLLTRAKDLLDLLATGWSADARELVFTEVPPSIQCAIGQIAIERPSDVRLLVRSEFCNFFATVSPDGRWMAYTSTVSGRDEIYIERYPELGNRQQISTGGGRLPLWSRDGRELFFTTPDYQQMLAVRVQSGTTLVAGRPQMLFEFAILQGVGYRPYDIAPDGRFLIIRSGQADAGGGTAQNLVVVQNWQEELKQRVPTR